MTQPRFEKLVSFLCAASLDNSVPVEEWREAKAAVIEEYNRVLKISPRFDAKVKYSIPSGLYKDIMAFLGLPRPVLCSRCEEEGYWVGGDFCKSMLDMLNECGDERALGMSSELYTNIAEPEPDEPVELQEV